MNELRTAIPTADARTGLAVLGGMLRDRSLLTALRTMRDQVGDIFRLNLPGFSPVVVSGPEHLKTVLLTERVHFDWRPEGDPVTRLLRQGVLVVDGPFHDQLRRIMDPSVNRSFARDQIDEFLRQTALITRDWEDGRAYDMLDEMRKIALLILVKTVFGVEMYADLDRLFDPIVRVIRYISPGTWIVWPDQPRPGYRQAIDTVNTYLYGLIESRRRQIAGDPDHETDDLLSVLVAESDLDDETIKDQLLTMLIAGHDTSTALLAWTLYLITYYPQEQNRLIVELDSVAGAGFVSRDSLRRLKVMDRVVRESLRLYPPIHTGNRVVNQDTQIGDYLVSRGSRLMYSIFLTHRDPKTWEYPDAFRPDRFAPENRDRIRSYSYVPFGAGPRMCIGAGFAQVESKVILSYLLRNFSFDLVDPDIHPHMGATLEPAPGVRLRVHKRRVSG